jgi:hypothetical protein
MELACLVWSVYLKYNVGAFFAVCFKCADLVMRGFILSKGTEVLALALLVGINILFQQLNKLITFFPDKFPPRCRGGSAPPLTKETSHLRQSPGFYHLPSAAPEQSTPLGGWLCVGSRLTVVLGRCLQGGFIWLFYGTPGFPKDERPPIPYVPELEDPSWKPVYGSIEFDCNHWRCGLLSSAVSLASPSRRR